MPMPWPDARRAMALLERGQVAEYLHDVGVLAHGELAHVERLAGGVSSAVFRVQWGTNAVVVKQALPKLNATSRTSDSNRTPFTPSRLTLRLPR